MDNRPSVREWYQTHCDTGGLRGLSAQIVQRLVTSGSLVNISDYVEIVGPSTFPYLQKHAAEALAAAVEEFGRKPKLVHALRVLPQQVALFFWYSTHRCGQTNLTAAPGTSPHEDARAIDLNDWQDWVPVLARHNWMWRGQVDRPHFGYHGPSDPDFSITACRAFQELFNEHNPANQIKVDGSLGPKTLEALNISPAEGW